MIIASHRGRIDAMLSEMRLASWGRAKFADIVMVGGWRWTRSSLTRSGPEGSSRNEFFSGRQSSLPPDSSY